MNANLKNCFPEKTTAEIIKLEKKFYRYYCDLLLETFKTLTISPKKMLQHCRLYQAADLLFKQLAAEHKSIIIVIRPLKYVLVRG